MDKVYKTVKTTKGTELPLLNLKNKPYMQVAHRIVWFVEEVPNYTIENELVTLTDEKALAKVTVSILDKDGKILKKVSDMKGETRKDFPDFVEKSLTGALGRCLASLGFGTAYALADLSEGERIVDSPVLDVKSDEEQVSVPKTSSFRPKASKPKTETTQGDEWQ